MDFNFIVAHLRNFFESPPQRFLARQALATCQQGPVESSAAFANRLLNLVRAATVGQDPITQRERVLEEYVARLRGDVRYFVRLDNPSTFEQAVSRAQMVEQLLAEATADKQMHPSSHSINQGVQALPTQVSQQALSPQQRPYFSGYNNPRSGPQPAVRIRQPAQTPRRRPAPRNNYTMGDGIRCYTCGGQGHLSRQCPTPRTSTPPPGTRPLTPSSPRQPPSSSPKILSATGSAPLETAMVDGYSLPSAQNRIQTLSRSLAATQQEVDESRALAHVSPLSFSETRNFPALPSNPPAVHHARLMSFLPSIVCS